MSQEQVLVEEVEEEPLFTSSQAHILTVLPIGPAILSAACSCLILMIILRNAKAKLQHIYHRLLLSLSVTDIINSINCATSGNATKTLIRCQINGVLFGFGISTAIYNTCLCVYFYLVVVRQWSAEKFRERKVEFWMHGLALGYPTAGSIVALVFKAFNPMLTLPGWCHFTDYPHDCNRLDDVDCIRGKNYFYIEIVAIGVPFLICCPTIMYTMFKIYRFVRSAEKRQSRYSYDSGTRGCLPLERTRQSAIQGILFAVTFCLTFGPAVINAFVGGTLEVTSSNETYFFVSSTLIAVCFPLQGFWNLFIFLRPRYRKVRRQFQSIPCHQVLRKAMFLDTGTSTSSQTTRASHDLFSSIFFRQSSRHSGPSRQQQQQAQPEPASPVPEMFSALDKGLEASPSHSSGSNSPVLNTVTEEAEEEMPVTEADARSSGNSCDRPSPFVDYCDDNENFVADPLYEDYESTSTALDETT